MLEFLMTFLLNALWQAALVILAAIIGTRLLRNAGSGPKYVIWATALILAFALLCFLIMLSLEGVFLRLLFRRRRRTDEGSGNVQLKGHATKELDSAHARAIPEPVPSVTEHTTRAFDPIYTERTSK